MLVLLNQKSSGGSGKNYIIKNDFNYFLNDKLNINIISEFQQNKGEGYLSGIKDVSRNIFSSRTYSVFSI